MINKEILKKAIEYAVSNGFKNCRDVFVKVVEHLGYYTLIMKTGIASPIYLGQKNDIIFLSDFAKALWGEGYTPVDYSHGIPILNKYVDWKYHQHEMLDYLQEGKEPLKYIEKYLQKLYDDQTEAERRG